jgi:hypothetical protein
VSGVRAELDSRWGLASFLAFFFSGEKLLLMSYVWAGC